MDFDLPVGKYVVAVSGGVDSVALLHALLKAQQGIGWVEELKTLNTLPKETAKPTPMGRTHRFVVAHFDHGIRDDSVEDRRFVEQLCKQYNVPFFYDKAFLGKDASEAVARKARYDFLHKVRKATQADAVITAHHQDDVLETIILNLLRGTNNRGLYSLRSTDTVVRPLTHLPKRTLRTYAKAHGLKWREDSTNTDTKYLRNYIRHHMVPKLGATRRGQLLNYGKRAAELQKEIDAHTMRYLHDQPHVLQLDRARFTMLPHAVSREVLAAWLRARTSVEVSSALLERLVVTCKTGRIGSQIDIAKGWRLHVGKDVVELRQAPQVV